MSNPTVRIVGNAGEYDGHLYSVRVVGDEIVIEYKTEFISPHDDMSTLTNAATCIAQQIKTLVKQ